MRTPEMKFRCRTLRFAIDQSKGKGLGWLSKDVSGVISHSRRVNSATYQGSRNSDNLDMSLNTKNSGDPNCQNQLSTKICFGGMRECQ